MGSNQGAEKEEENVPKGGRLQEGSLPELALKVEIEKLLLVKLW